MNVVDSHKGIKEETVDEVVKDGAAKGGIMKDEVVRGGVETGNSAAVASMVLGIISIVSAFFWYMALPAGTLAIILGNRSNKEKKGSSMSKAGLIMGIVGLSLCVFVYVSIIMIMLVS